MGVLEDPDRPESVQTWGTWERGVVSDFTFRPCKRLHTPWDGDTCSPPPPCIAAPAACPPPLTRRRWPGVLSQGPPHRRGHAPQHVRLHGAGQRPHPCGAPLRPPLRPRVPGQSRGGPGARGRGHAHPSLSSVPRGVSLCSLCSEAPASVLSVFTAPCVVRRLFLFGGRRTWTRRSTTACGTRRAGTPPRAAPPSARTPAAAARAKADARARKLPGFLRAALVSGPGRCMYQYRWTH